MRETLVDALAALDAQLPWRVPVIVAGERRDEPTLLSHDPGAPERIVAEATTATTADVDAAVRAAARRRAGVGGSRRSRPRRDPLARRRRAAPAPRDARGARGARVRQAVGGGRRRRLRGDRLPRVLRAAGGRAGGRERARAAAGRAQHAALRRARRRRRRSARGTSRWRSPPGWSRPGWRPATASCSSPPSSRRRARYAVVEALHAAGVPPEVLSFLPGEGEVGAALVAHPGVHTIAFTGSGRGRAARSCARPRSWPPASATSSASWPRWAARTA